MDERERLERAFREVLFGEGRSASELVKALADAAMKAPEKPTPRPVWPGLEGEGLEKVRRLSDAVWRKTHEATMEDAEAASRDYYTAITAHLFRALVAGLPRAANWPNDHVLIGGWSVPRSALAALADPYDGGGK